jgi:small subunit ribosomal protein S4e
MARGPPKHLKRINAPKNWMLDKLGGVYATRPRPGPHKLLECLPLISIIRNRLKYATTYPESFLVLKQRFLKVDGKVRTDPKFPVGFMDVITIEKTGDKFRIMYDTKGRFTLVKISEAESGFKLCRVKNVMYAPNRTPFLSTHDGRTIRFPDPNIRINDTVVVDTASGKIKEWVRFRPGAVVMITGGANTGRIGEIVSRERHPGSFDIVRVKDAADNKFATRIGNCFVIGAGATTPLVTLPRQKGIKTSLVVDRERKLAEMAKRKKGKH